jgi:FSR family fosmidomycin resistance protein-like MFS transporter
MLTILALCGAVGTLFSGPLAERIGRRNVMVAAMIVVLVALGVFLRSDGIVRLLALAVGGAAITAPWTLTVVMVQDAMPNNLGLAGGLTLGTAYGASGLGVAALGLYADYAGLAATLHLLTLLPALVLLLSVFVPNRAPKA